MLFIPFLFYFPVREYVGTTGNYKQILWALLSISTVVAIVNLFRYRNAIAIAYYLFEVWGKRQVAEEPLYMSAILLSFAVILMTKKSNILILLSLVINIISLGVTFSRGYWVATIFGVFVFLLIVGYANVKKMIWIFGGVAIFLTLISILLFPNIIGSMSRGILMRIGTIGWNDISFQTRLNESNRVISLIAHSPILGYGLGSVFSYYDLITKYHVTNWYIHNGYLFLMFKFGIVGTFLFLTYYGRFTFSCYRSISQFRYSGIRPIFVSIFSISIAMLILSFSSPQFYDKASVLILSSIWGINEGIKSYNNYA
jgi:O-antigen ligase